MNYWVLDEEGIPQKTKSDNPEAYPSLGDAMLIEDTVVLFLKDNKIIEAVCLYYAKYGLLAKINGLWSCLAIDNHVSKLPKIQQFLGESYIIKFREPPEQWGL